ncbi:MAG TPA: DUF4142 domain-containing protein [Longimicrobiales bacterium]|nr:DUF4142 domain-containing protein [Longimicrobiales bacterium]
MREHGGWMRAAALLVVMAGCANADGEEQVGESSTPAAEVGAPEGDQAAAPSLNDAQIAAIVVTANGIDVANGEQALEKSSNAQVRQFAETMVGTHTAVNESAAELVARLGVTPEENDVSRSLQADAEQTRARLAALSGAEFDRAYIENEIAFHEAVIDAVDSLLIPNATNGELRQTLVDARPVFEGHLTHARTVQQQLSGS